MAFVPALIMAAATIGSTLLAKSGNKSPKIKQQSTLTPEQRELQKNIKMGLEGKGPLADLFGKFNPESFNKNIGEPQLKKFQEETLPSIQEKYIAGNQVLGTGMQRAKVKGASDFQAKLSELMYGAEKDQNQNRLRGIETLSGRQSVENYVQPGKPSAWNAVSENISKNSDTYLKLLESAMKSTSGGATAPSGAQIQTSTVAGGV